MTEVSRAIILAAGRSLQLDGACKALLRHPRDGRTVLDYAEQAFAGMKVTVVVGFRAVEIMQAYPQFDYVLNADWALSNNAMSLALALGTEPTFVLPGDVFLDRSLVERLQEGPANLALVSRREKRGPTAIHCVLDDSGHVTETYQGPVREIAHPESLGLFKVSDTELLKQWHRKCSRHGNLFAGQLLPVEQGRIESVELRVSESYSEVNTPADYIELIAESRES